MLVVLSKKGKVRNDEQNFGGERGWGRPHYGRWGLTSDFLCPPPENSHSLSAMLISRNPCGHWKGSQDQL